MVDAQKNTRKTTRERGAPPKLVLLLILLLILLLLFHLFSSFKLLQKVSGCGTEIDENVSPAHKAGYSPAHKVEYSPAGIEAYLVNNSVNLGWDVAARKTSGCKIWTDPKATTIHPDLTAYRDDIKKYSEAVRDFTGIPDLMETIKTTKNNDICSSAKIHPDGIEALFPSHQISYGEQGYMEPLAPPMRSPEFCFERSRLMLLDYLVHDYEAMCMKLKPTSRRIFIDMGASLSFHADTDPPALQLLKEYKKFGFHFDHIYAFEITPFEPQKVFETLLPSEYMASYHWINTGVNPEKENPLNPFYSIIKNFNHDDFIVVKLDVDTPSVEVPLAKQLLEDESIHALVDQFYFEHHVFIQEMLTWWSGPQGSIKDSLDLFYGLRQKGVAAHSWV